LGGAAKKKMKEIAKKKTGGEKGKGDLVAVLFGSGDAKKQNNKQYKFLGERGGLSRNPKLLTGKQF